MKPPTLRRRFVTLMTTAALFFVVFTPGTLRAQEEQPGIFGEIIDVRVVNLEVVVTDRAGNRVSGLAPEDFRLSVDGDEVPIDYFSEVALGLVAGDRPQAEGSQQTTSAQSVPSLTPGRPVGTSYLVFIDDFFSVRRDRNHVLESLEQEFGHLRPQDRMAVVAFDGKKLKMLTSWTNSSPQLEDAFREARGRPAFGLNRRQELQSFRATQGFNINQRAIQNVGARLTPEARQYVELLSSQVGRQISAASATLRSFAMPPGRKVMLLLAGGWPFDPTQLAGENPHVPVLDREFERGDELFRPLADTANLLGYTLYPVDVPGLEGTGPSVSARSPGAIAGASLAAEQEVHAGLGLLARRTGGKALLNSLRTRPLETVVADTRSYYWLGFTADRKHDDAAHKIKIEARRKGLKVRSRKGFLDFSRRAEASAMVESTLLFGSSPSEGAMPVKIGEVKRAGRRFIEVPVTLAIPISSMTVLPQGKQWVSELELRIAVMDEEGNQADMPVIPLRLESPKEPQAGSYVRYETSLKLRRSKHDVVLAIFDPATGRQVTNRVEIAP